MHFNNNYTEVVAQRDMDAREAADDARARRDMLETIRTWGTKERNQAIREREAAGVSHMGDTRAQKKEKVA
jgi:hypothetical protein